MRRSDGRALLVRKRDTDTFIQLGGKIALGETAAEAVVRKLHEELGVQSAIADLVFLGECEDWAVQEPGWIVRAIVFSAPYSAIVVPFAEIAEASWVDAGERGRCP
ncbi:NUDIX hydrolase [Dyella japonica]|uniref:NUDIX hydrolase n=1 Tax=Dyella japonica TaxID=231455 RepID=UPI001B80AD17